MKNLSKKIISTGVASTLLASCTIIPKKEESVLEVLQVDENKWSKIHTLWKEIDRLETYDSTVFHPGSGWNNKYKSLLKDIYETFNLTVPQNLKKQSIWDDSKKLSEMQKLAFLLLTRRIYDIDNQRKAKSRSSVVSHSGPNEAEFYVNVSIDRRELEIEKLSDLYKKAKVNEKMCRTLSNIINIRLTDSITKSLIERYNYTFSHYTNSHLAIASQSSEKKILKKSLRPPYNASYRRKLNETLSLINSELSNKRKLTQAEKELLNDINTFNALKGKLHIITDELLKPIKNG